MSAKVRLDELVFARGLAESRAKAQALIMAGKILSGTQRLDKPGKKVEDDIPLTLISPPRFVSRGGEKLEAFLLAYPSLSVKGAIGLDIGASTGGFTDCLLQHGAAEVVAIDVGHGQLHPKIKADPRVKSFEGINARSVTAEELPYAQYDVMVMDVAFISQTKLLENIWQLLKPGGFFVSLIKPQFEVTKQEADKAAGVIQDEAIRARVVAEVRAFALAKLPGLSEEGFAPSAVVGAEGNQEYLVAWRRAAL